ncbi:MAG: hypothetical protein HY904_14335 [Deltaproteobacteria bacterium]|nr:hypothetical protein [Deltaproteobacteria bacterium]
MSVYGVTRGAPALALLLVACGTADGTGGTGPASSSSGGTGEPAGMEGMVAAHNAVRARATPAPSPPLGTLTWSETAAAVAQGWANQLAADCSQLAHNPARGDLGENAAWTSDPTSTATAVVEMWAGEAACYDLAANACSCAQCGHYTQLVWRTTTEVGCGTARCTRGAMAGRFWVCNYDPPGNYLGHRPY